MSNRPAPTAEPRPDRPDRPDPPAPPTTPRPDLRLLPPAATAWATTAALLPTDHRHTPLVLTTAALAVLAALPLLARGRRHGLPAVLLTAAAAASATTLHTADLHRGPLPALARLHSQATVELTLTSDPVALGPRVRGSGRGQSMVVIHARADRVTARTTGTTTTRTPVTVIAQGTAAAQWLPLLPSTRVAADTTALPPSDPAEPTAAVLLTRAPPRLLAPPSAVQRAAGSLRQGLRRAADPLAPDARALLPGLVVGDTSRLPDDLRDAFRTTDLAHLTAVSGANLSIILAVLLGSPSRAATPERGGLAARLGLPLRTTAAAGTALTAAFVVLCRPEPSVLRAAATGLIGLLALAAGRRSHALTALSAAVLLLLLADPWLARDYGFLLSVLATAGLLTLGPRWSAALARRGWPVRLAEATGAASAAQAFCGPVIVLLTARVSLVAVPCNLLAELAVAPATLVGFAALAIAPVSATVAGLLARLAGIPTGWLAAVARHGAALPGAQVAWPAGWAGAAALAVVTAAAACAAPAVLPRLRRHPFLTVLLVLALLATLLRPPLLTRIATGWPPPGWRLVMCDVGQGDMAVLPAAPGAAPDTAVVIDTGPDPRAADACLRSLGVTRVALVILTHFHADHVEGLPGVLHGRTVAAVQTTTLDDPPGEEARVLRWAARSGVPVVRAAPREHRTAAPGVTWDVLWPDGPAAPDAPGPNNSSIAAVAIVHGLRIALLGDLEPPAQAHLLAHGAAALGRVDVLKVAHHGSAHQDWSLTAALHPRLALISCGQDNPYGHPAPATVAYLTALGATVLRTDTSGDIAVLGDTPATLHAAVHPHHPDN
ncbi:ComEC/Rec2 family competence protein [Peterkaempfera bronchialis]|uniref:ComEC/Rec2 family competence protein n=1 Tax=Peterkaempfera bronchialis TaxID=2126346 RepID=A0A345SUW4_9ACTN|nr:ComEC/Rec2 family competence protein [Peterkaempfera bronchialis]AXI77519.1 ComEC/Rec2 family competence protein [Peterkaempfera bronchialis]